MGSIKSVMVFTIAITIIIINDHKSNANYCIDQITKDGGFDIDFNRKEAFKYAYLHITLDSVKNLKKYFLLNYIEENLASLFKVQGLPRIDSPQKWKNANYPDSPKQPFLNNIKTFPKAIKHAFFNTTENDYVDIIHIGYYNYMLEKMLERVRRSGLVGPSQFCRYYTVEVCKSSIEKYGEINFDLTVKDVFKYIYNNVSFKVYFCEKDILRQYTQDLFDESVPKNIETIINSPMHWCISYYDVKQTYMVMDNKQLLCTEILQNSDFADIKTSKAALELAFFELKKNELTCEFSKEYYSYIIDTFLFSVDFSNAEGPLEFCENHFQSLEYSSDSNENNK